MNARHDDAGRVLVAISGYDPEQWRALIEPRRTAVLEPDGPAAPLIRYAIVWKQVPAVLATLPNLKAIFSAGAGVDHLLASPHLPEVPIVRVVDPNLTQYMVEYVCWRGLDHHRQGRVYREQQPQKLWHEPPQPMASQVSVGVMGLGHLGRACARSLAGLGFSVRGWSRTERTLDGVTTFHGAAGLDTFLAGTDILVVLLPLTAATRGIIDAALLKALRRDGPLGGPILINAGRGGLQKEADILRALDDGTLKEASLDVFETEPLPASSALWEHPRVMVTPHAAATSFPDQLVPPMLDQMDACDRGEPLVNVVDREAGY